MKLLTLFLASAASVALAGPVLADTLRASTWLPSNDIHTVHAFNEWAETIRTDTGGDVEMDIFAGGALMPAKAHLTGIGDGIAHVGFPASGYTPSDLPVANALSGLGFEEPDAMVLAFAFADFMMNEEIGYNDYAQHGTVPVGGFSTPIYELICKDAPIHTLDDLRGKRIRFPGGQGAKLAAALGVVTVNIPGTEVYTGLTQGQLDCTANDLTYLTSSQQLIEVSNSVTMVSLTPSFNSVMHVWNKNAWQGLTDEQRRAVLDANARAMARLQIDWDVQAIAALEAAKAAGHRIIEADASITEAIQSWIDDGVGDMAGVARDAHGIEDPEAMFAAFRTYRDKWKALLNGMEDRHDEAALTALIKTNLFDTVDVGSYGLE